MADFLSSGPREDSGERNRQFSLCISPGPWGIPSMLGECGWVAAGWDTGSTYFLNCHVSACVGFVLCPCHSWGSSLGTTDFLSLHRMSPCVKLNTELSLENNCVGKMKSLGFLTQMSGQLWLSIVHITLSRGSHVQNQVLLCNILAPCWLCMHLVYKGIGSGQWRNR